MSATTLSCPECQTTLKSGTPIPPGKRIKCPQCGAVFSAPPPGAQAPDDEEEARIVRRKIEPSIPLGRLKDEGPAVGDQEEEEYDEEPVGRPSRRRRQRPSNTAKILAVSIASALIILLFVGGTAYFIWNNVVNKGRNKGTGKENPLAFVPADSTVVFGLDMGPLWEQPAIAAELEKILGRDPQDFFGDLKKNTGIQNHEFLDRLVLASKTDPANPMQPPPMTLIFQSKIPFDQNKVRDKVRDSEKDMVPQTAGGKTYYKRSSAMGAELGWLYMPSDRILVLSNMPEAQMKELVESDGIEPKVPAQVMSMAEELQSNLFWVVLPFSAAVKQQMQRGLALAGNNPPELMPVTNALPQAKMLALSGNLANNKIAFQVSLVCADESAAKEVATSLQNYWEKNSKGLAGMQIKLGLALVPKEFQATVKEILDNLQLSSQGATAHLNSQFTAPSSETLAKLVTSPASIPLPGRVPGGVRPGGPAPGFRRGGGFNRQG